MARIRSVKPELRTSKVVTAWPFDLRYFWVLLWGYLDDYGRGQDIAKTIAGDCYPLDDAITAKTVERWLSILATKPAGRDDAPLCRYEILGNRYIHAVNWKEHQRVNRPTRSRIPPCPLHELLMDENTEPLPDSLSEEFSEPLNVGGGRREEGGRKGEGDSLNPAPRPNAWCPKHPGGSDDPCRSCGTARQAAEAWDRAAPSRKTARLLAAPRCQVRGHETEIAASCRQCAADLKGTP